MTNNPILEELRETRERLHAEAGGTLEGLVARLQRDELHSGREFISPKARTSRCTNEAKQAVSAMESQSSPIGAG